MDLQQLIAQFFDDNGNIALPEHFTLPRLSETIYQAHLAAGGGDAVRARFVGRPSIASTCARISSGTVHSDRLVFFCA